MAATHGRLTGAPGVCIATLGPGALNLTTGAAYALLGAMPMVMLTGQKGVLHSKQGQFQIVDMVATMTPLTKHSRQIVSPITIPSMVREAFRMARLERPGPGAPGAAGGHCFGTRRTSRSYRHTPLIPPSLPSSRSIGRRR